jgi:hypothetical protein
MLSLLSFRLRTYYTLFCQFRNDQGKLPAAAVICSMTLKLLEPKFSPLGGCGVRIAFGGEISLAIRGVIRWFGAALDAKPIYGMTKRVCGYAVVTVYYLLTFS